MDKAINVTLKILIVFLLGIVGFFTQLYHQDLRDSNKKVADAIYNIDHRLNQLEFDWRLFTNERGLYLKKAYIADNYIVVIIDGEKIKLSRWTNLIKTKQAEK